MSKFSVKDVSWKGEVMGGSWSGSVSRSYLFLMREM